MSQKIMKLLAAGFFAWGLAWGPESPAEDAAQPVKTDEKTFVGEIIDPAAYLKDGRHGIEMTEQTYTAVDGGQTLALLEDGSGNVYLLLTEEAGEDPNELAYDYVNQQVKVVGRVYEKGGLRGLIPSTVDPVAATAPASPDSN